MQLQTPEASTKRTWTERAGPPPPDSRQAPCAPAADQTPPRWRATLALIERHVPFVRRRLPAGAAVQHAGDAFEHLYLVHWGAVKSVAIAADGCAQIAGLHIKGDWIGFDSMGLDRCVCNVRAMNDIEIWSLHYASLLKLAGQMPQLGHSMHAAMAEQLARERHWRLALATMPADARLADFLCLWADTLAQRELRDDHIVEHLTRTEIANYLGMSEETASRAFSALERLGLIVFDGAGRRQFVIPDIAALTDFIDSRAHGCSATLPGH